MKNIAANDIEIYNEFSLQHELGIYLREQFPKFKVQYERNIKYFNIENTVKHEIDIVMFNAEQKYAIELKFPLNGQYPEQMYSFVRDIKFTEQLHEKGCNKAFCLTVVRDKNFYQGNKADGIYAYFRDNKKIREKIYKPTGHKDEYISLDGEYSVNWSETESEHYYIIEITD